MSRIFRLLSQLLDVDLTSTPPVDGDALTYDSGSEKWVPAAGGAGADDQTAAEVPFTPAGTIAATDTQSAVEEVATDAAAAVAALSSVYQPLDSDLTSIAALTTTSFGRGLLALANQAALLSAAGAAAASHVHAGEDITSGTVADARIASTIARDSEVTSAISALSSVYQPLDSDLTSIAALTTTTFGRAFLALADEAAFKAAVNLEAGTDFPSQSTFDDHSARHEDGGADEVSIAGLSGTSAALQAHLDDTADAHDASAISVLDTATNFAGTDVEAVLAELQDNIDAGGGGGPVLLADTTLGSDTASFDFTSISGSYTHLRLVTMLRTDSSDNAVLLKFNNDSGSNYSYEILLLHDAYLPIQANSQTIGTIIYCANSSAPTSEFSKSIIDIPFYVQTTSIKQANTQGGTALGFSTGNLYGIAGACWWNSTAAISRVTISIGSGNFKTGSRIQLYGIT